MVRASDEALDRLRTLREVTGISTAELIDRAVELLERDHLLDAANESFAALRDDPEAWRSERVERDLWEGAIADGLKDE